MAAGFFRRRAAAPDNRAAIIDRAASFLSSLSAIKATHSVFARVRRLNRHAEN
jgi:hypothetical protein